MYLDRSLFSQEHVRILSLLKQILQHVQLLPSEGGSLAPLLTGRLLRRQGRKYVRARLNMHLLGVAIFKVGLGVGVGVDLGADAGAGLGLDV